MNVGYAPSHLPPPTPSSTRQHQSHPFLTGPLSLTICHHIPNIFSANHPVERSLMLTLFLVRVFLLFTLSYKFNSKVAYRHAIITEGRGTGRYFFFLALLAGEALWGRCVTYGLGSCCTPLHHTDYLRATGCEVHHTTQTT